MKRLLLILALLIVAATACTPLTTIFHPVTNPTTSVVRCEEDQPCWDCHEMGNRICGPGAG